jgi:hypothetical protein
VKDHYSHRNFLKIVPMLSLTKKVKNILLSPVLILKFYIVTNILLPQYNCNVFESLTNILQLLFLLYKCYSVTHIEIQIFLTHLLQLTLSSVWIDVTITLLSYNCNVSGSLTHIIVKIYLTN